MQTLRPQYLQVGLLHLLIASRGHNLSQFSTFSVGHIHGHQKSRGGYKDQLQAPQADVRNRKEMIIADIFATWLLRVAIKVGLFVAPDFLSGQNQNGDPEDEEDRKPDLPQAGGVFVDTTQLTVKRGPRHRGTGRSVHLQGAEIP